jgi:adenylosuccinate synthase
VTNQVYVVAGLAYGDEGKGATVDFLTREKKAGLVVRYNGGPQAGHNVVTPDGRHHTFSQFGSGTFVAGVRTHLSRFMLVNPISMLEEEKHLRFIGVKNAFKRTTIDAECLIVTPFQRAVNRIQQLAMGLHTSCGSGVGQTRQDHLDHGEQVLVAGDIENDWVLDKKLTFQQEISRKIVENVIGNKKIREELEVLIDPEAVDWVARQYSRWFHKVSIVDSLELSDLLEETECTIFEGAQGVLLDEKHGETGYNTWTNTTFENAETLLKECGYVGPVCKLGVIRTYFTRHGDGPLRTENPKLLELAPELHNNGDGFQGKFRTGHFDLQAFQYSLQCCNGVDALAVNHTDIFGSRDSIPLDVHEVPVLIAGSGPRANDRELNEAVDFKIKKDGGTHESSGSIVVG